MSLGFDQAVPVRLRNGAQALLALCLAALASHYQGRGVAIVLWIGTGLSALVLALDLVRGWLGSRTPRGTRAAALVRDELVAIIDEGERLAPDAFRPVAYGPYILWRDKASVFIERTLGSVERQRFNAAFEPPPTTLDRNLRDHLRRLADIRDRPETWKLFVDRDEAEIAAHERRVLADWEGVVLAGEPVAS